MVERLIPNRQLAVAAIILSGLLALGWGGTGHRFINLRAALHLPPSMEQFIGDSTYFADHASDADSRKGSDPTESPKHYIDLELIPAFEHLTRDLDSLNAVMGAAAVSENGILPWATADAYDSLVAQLARGDWARARLSASDLGHYVADGHNPLHATANYNGQLTGNSGIHSLYESELINAYQSELFVQPASAEYVHDPFATALAYCVSANALVHTIMIADDEARAISGWTGTRGAPASYLGALWERTKDLTAVQMQLATETLASLWYSAWIDAGLLALSSTSDGRSHPAGGFALGQNYPNPFNPATTIWLTLPTESLIQLSVYDLTGRLVAVLGEGWQPSGTRSFEFDGSRLASGVYIYRLQLMDPSAASSGSFVQSRRMILLR